MNKREFLAASVGLGLGLGRGRSVFAQERSATPARTDSAVPAGGGRVPSRMAKTTKLFKSPPGFPNAIAIADDGLWIGEQKLSGELAAMFHMTEPKDLSENAWLVDWNGKLLKTVRTPSRNTSGMAFGGGYVWMVANEPPFGVFQVDMNSKVVSHRQIPLGTAKDGGGCHGALWHEGKLWIASLRLHGMLRLDPATWQPEYMIPFYEVPGRTRSHGIAWDNGSIWQVIGNDSNKFSDGWSGLLKYDVATGKVLEMVELAPGSADPHGLAVHDGKLISCDAGFHPGWPANESPTSGWIFRIDLI